MVPAYARMHAGTPCATITACVPFAMVPPLRNSQTQPATPGKATGRISLALLARMNPYGRRAIATWATPGPRAGPVSEGKARWSAASCAAPSQPVPSAVDPAAPLSTQTTCRTAHAVDHDGTMSAVQWGSVSTWVAGVGTVAAVSLALWEARGERKERLRRELRQQAERISAWFVGMHKDPDGEDPDDGNPDGEDSHRDAWLPPELRGRAADVELLNNSEDPVTDVLVFLSRVSYKVQRWWDQEPEYRVMIGVLPPGRWAIRVPRSAGAIVNVKLGGSPAGSRVIAVISFTDSAGNHWARGARSELRRLPAAAFEYWKVHREDIDWRVPTRLN